jgi:PIN domain nuclease of toxin-antitoxin system
MKLLLDTHAFIWLNDNPSQLSENIIAMCQSGEHEFFLSMASAWEMQIKSQLGKLHLSMPVRELIETNINENHIYLLPITLPDIEQLEKLPPHHKDPFDRMIIAQAMLDDFTIVSIDGAFADYDVPVIW